MSFMPNMVDEMDDPHVQIEGPILSVDIGSVSTRALLLDLVEGRYRFVALGESPTTTGEPWYDVSAGVYDAIEQVSKATGRAILDQQDNLIMPEVAPFMGVRHFALTASAGDPIRAVLFGLVPDLSLASAQRAAESIYISLVDTFSLSDPRTPAERIDAFLEAQPDIVIVVGGTDGGAIESVERQLDLIGMAYSLMEEGQRPPLLYAGNQAMSADVVKAGSEAGIDVITAENVRPTLEIESLEDIQQQLAAFYNEQKTLTSGGIAELAAWSTQDLLPTAFGFARIVHLLGGLRGENVLGIDLGSSGATVAALIDGVRTLNVFDALGVGHGLAETLPTLRLENVARWLTTPPADDALANYLYNKSLFPHTLPATATELEYEYALARELVRRAVLNARLSWRDVPQRGPLPDFGAVLLSGATLARTPDPGWTMLMALDALLPVTALRVLTDPYGLAPSLGALAASSPEAVTQVLEAGSFRDLGTAIPVNGRPRIGEVVLTGRLKRSGSAEETFELRGGEILRLPLRPGEEADLSLQPNRVDVAGSTRSRRLKVTGGDLGVVLDARGRPWRFPRGAEERARLLASWRDALVGEGG